VSYQAKVSLVVASAIMTLCFLALVSPIQKVEARVPPPPPPPAGEIWIEVEGPHPRASCWVNETPDGWLVYTRDNIGASQVYIPDPDKTWVVR